MKMFNYTFKKNHSILRQYQTVDLFELWYVCATCYFPIIKEDRLNEKSVTGTNMYLEELLRTDSFYLYIDSENISDICVQVDDGCIQCKNCECELSKSYLGQTFFYIIDLKKVKRCTIAEACGTYWGLNSDEDDEDLLLQHHSNMQTYEAGL